MRASVPLPFKRQETISQDSGNGTHCAARQDAEHQKRGFPLPHKIEELSPSILATHPVSQPQREGALGHKKKNLWVLAGFHIGEDAHNHRSQRPGMNGNHGKTLHKLGLVR
jgi:hypothetical protein